MDYGAGSVSFPAYLNFANQAANDLHLLLRRESLVHLTAQGFKQRLRVEDSAPAGIARLGKHHEA
ncbi:MAG: hypothetical protein M3362_22135, partial [Acidobacteriota bacterium]|nr:hypothetical protein [Acidobacteriota bacterium]